MQVPEDHARYIIDRGHRAGVLLQDENFLGVVDDLTTYHLSALVAATPGPSGAEAVAYHHLIQFALTEIVSTLKGYEDAGQQQLAELEFASANEDD